MPEQKLTSSYLKYKICISGAACTDHCTEETFRKTKELAKEIVRRNGVVVTGATTGVPYWAAMAAKEAGGISIGISPAVSEIAHVKTYHLPVDYFDLIIYTGFEYAGRNLLLTRAADAVIVICGRIGTLNEFTIAFEDNKPIGVLAETGGTTEMIKEIVERGRRPYKKIVYDADPKKLVEKVLQLVEAEKVVKIPKIPPKKGRRG